MNDSDLLRRFVVEHSQDAFAELVRRRVGLVYSAALRQVGGDTHRAEDVTQEVFIDLARKAGALTRHPALIGWLYTSTHFAAAKLVRTEQRRTQREQEAHVMNDSTAAPASLPDWDRVRPVLDAAMHELDERDRQTVLLRFFDQQPFARIGEQLGLSENAAQKNVDRALDKLQAALARRGVKSTGAALGLALASQAGAAAPAALATSITGTALAGAGAVTGIWAMFTTSKFVAGLAGGAALLAGGVAVTEHRQTREAEAALAVAEQQRSALQTQVTTMAARLAQVEQRTAEAEKDSGELLKAVEALRAQQAAARAAQAAASRLPPGDPTAPDDERLVHERAYQQELARRRADQAKAQAQKDIEASQLDPAAQYERLIAEAEQLLAKAEFQLGIRTYNRAMAAKPADFPVTERVKQLQAALAAQSKPVDVTFASDGQTWVSVTNVRAPSKFVTSAAKLLPGNYQVIGRRKGYRDVTIEIAVRDDASLPPITVVCTVTNE